MLDLNLQMFAEDVEVESEGVESGGHHKDDSKQVTVGEMKRRLGNQAKKYEEDIEAIKASVESQITEAIEREREIAKLNGKELEAYKQKEAEKKYQSEIDKRDKELEALRAENLQRTIRDEAQKKLETLKITYFNFSDQKNITTVKRFICFIEYLFFNINIFET